MALTKITPQMFDTSTAGHDFNIDNGTFVVDASANRVGIGTTSPAQTLHVSSTAATSNGIRISNSEGSFEARVDQGEFYLYDVDDNRIPFLIDTSGNVGIGTATPSTLLDVNGVLTATSIAGTLTTAAQTNITSVGTLTALTVDDITIDGSTISDAADFTIDAGTDIILDADSGVWRFKDAGTTVFQVARDGNSYLGLYSGISDMDMRFQGNDGGSTVTALTLDMSEAGAATFNSNVGIGGSPNTYSGYGTVTVNGTTGSLLDLEVNGTLTGEVFADSSGFGFQTIQSDQDIIFKGNDGGSTITALTLDMSAKGSAIFNEDANVIIQGTHNEGGGLLFLKGTDTAASSKNLGSLCFGNPSDACLAMIRGVTTDTTAADLRFFTEAQGAAIEERFRIASDGKVGISEGGVIYASRFSVGKPANHTPGSVFTSSPSSFFSEAALGGTTGNSQKIAIFGGSDASNVSGLAIYRYRRSTGTNWTTDGFSLRQEVDSTASIYDYMNFAGGNVGIGSANPDSALHILKGSGAGHNGIRIDNTTSYYAQLNFYTTGGNRRGFIQSAGDGDLEVGTDSSSGNLQLFAGGQLGLEIHNTTRNIGVGVTPDTSGGYKFKVYSGDYVTMKLRAPTYPVLRFEAVNQNSGNNASIGVGAGNAVNINPNNATVGLSIDNTGIVTAPNQPYVQGRGNAGWTAYSGSAIWEIQPHGASPVTSRDHNSDYSTTNKRFTCPVDGVYLVMASWYIYQTAVASAGSQYIHPALYRNGVLAWNGGVQPYTIYGHEINRAGTSSKHYDGIQMSYTIYCSANDYLDIRAYTPNSNTQSYENYHYFSYTLLS